MLKESSYLSEKLQYLLDFHKKHLEDTLSKEKLMDLLQLEDKEDLKLKILKNFALKICSQFKIMRWEMNKLNEEQKKKNETLFMPESLLKNKLMIWKDKFNLSKKKLQSKERALMISSLSQILALELISIKKEQTFFWITHCQEQSEKLSLLTEIDCQDSDLIYSKQLLSNPVENSQLLTTFKANLQSKNSQRICSQSFISSHVNKWENGATKTENVQIKTLKFRIYPNSEQKKIIKEYANAFKFVYNKTIKRLSDEKLDSRISKIDLRDELVTEKTRKYSKLWNKCNSNKSKLSAKLKKFRDNKKKSLKDCAEFIINERKYNKVKNQYDFLKTIIEEKKQKLHDFEKKASKELRTIAVNEAFTSWRTNADLVLMKKKSEFEMKFKTKKDFRRSYTFGITPAMFKLENEVIHFTDKKLTDKKIQIGKKSKKSLYKIKSSKQAEILFKDNKYYIHLCVDLKEENIKSKQIENIIGLDPGSSTFLSGFSNKEILKYQQSDLLFKLNEKLFKLKADRTKKYTKNGNSKNKQRVMRRIEVRKSNIVDNMHWQVINDLCKNYEVICLEKFSSKKCVESNGLSKVGKQNLTDLKHFQFRQRLTFKANNQGIEVILVNPHNTSKFCSSCGNVKPSMELKDRIYNCSECGLTMCRDLNACKNMLMLGISSKVSNS